MNRLETDFLVIDLIFHGAPVEYVLQRLVRISLEGKEQTNGKRRT